MRAKKKEIVMILMNVRVMVTSFIPTMWMHVRGRVRSQIWQQCQLELDVGIHVVHHYILCGL